MPRAKTPSFITELPLKVNSQQARELNARFQAARQLYNACLSEAMIRLKLVKSSVAYQDAKKLPKNNKKLQEARAKAFAEANEAQGYTEYAIHAYATIVRNNSRWIAEKVDSNTCQKLATRAFKATQRVMFGSAKKVRFKVNPKFKSVEGKSNKTGIRWLENQVVWGRDLILEPIIDWLNPVIKHGLESPVKYVRLIRRELNRKERWFAQLINEGLPYQKPQNSVNTGVFGLDLNISNIAFVADNKAGLLPFAEHVPTFEKEIKHLHRKMERSRRATNPENYEPDFKAKQGNKLVKKKGKLRRGSRQQVKSHRYLEAAQKKREIERKKSAYAKSQNRKLVNEILRHGNQIQTENVSVKGWQKRYGKAISAKSPGYFQSELKRKAESAGGSFTTFSTQKTALSQTHLTGERIKKSLSERVHHDVSGFTMHRDLFSAFLSRYVNQDMLSLQDAQQEYPRSEPILLEAWKVHETAKQVGKSESTKSDSSSERFSKKPRTIDQIGEHSQQRMSRPKSQS